MPITCPVQGCTNPTNYRQRPCADHLMEFSAAGVKWCSNPGCDDPAKTVGEFHRNRSTDDGLAGWCKTCIKNYATEKSDLISTRTAKRREANPGLKHGLTAEQYWGMWTRQDDKCAICAKRFDRGGTGATRPCIDHDHAHCPGGSGCPKCVRSLLCNSCNVMLGRAFDDPVMLRRLKPTRKFSRERIDSGVAYLEYWRSEMVKRGIKPSIEDALWCDAFDAISRLVASFA